MTPRSRERAAAWHSAWSWSERAMHRARVERDISVAENAAPRPTSAMLAALRADVAPHLACDWDATSRWGVRRG